MRNTRLSLFLTAATLLQLAPLKAQLDQGQIAGTIQDSSFAAVGKATRALGRPRSRPSPSLSS